MRIAVVEDSKLLTQLWRRALAKTSYDLDVVTSDTPEIEALLKNADLVVLGCTPKSGTAKGFIKEIRTSPGGHETTIVLATSLDATAFGRVLDITSVDHILIKPFSAKRILELFNQINAEVVRRKRTVPLCCVVDDARLVRIFLREQLEGLGFEVHEAENGLEGLALIKKHLPDIIIADVEMPVMTGLEMGAQLLEDPSTRHLPILVCSSIVDSEMVRRGFESGTVHFLGKPMTQQQLHNSVSAIMGTNRVGQNSNTRALIVEDSLVVSVLIERLLDELGIESYSCTTMADFEAHANVMVPDLITLDLNLPDGEGVELVKRVRSCPRLEDVPLIVVSGLDDHNVMVECLEVGANDFMHKPFGRAEFIARVRGFQRIKRLQDELERKNHALEELAYHDHLTGLFNRTYFDMILTRELDRSERTGQTLAALFVDIDHFKAVNDTHGHDVGDEVLASVAHAMRTSVRSYDLPCRYGGEEFIILLPQTEAAGALTVAERIRKRVARGRHGDSKLEITCSIGISIFPDTSARKTLCKDADSALYRAKHSGRNRCELSRATPAPARSTSAVPAEVA